MIASLNVLLLFRLHFSTLIDILDFSALQLSIHPSFKIWLKIFYYGILLYSWPGNGQVRDVGALFLAEKATAHFYFTSTTFLKQTLQQVPYLVP